MSTIRMAGYLTILAILPRLFKFYVCAVLACLLSFPSGLRAAEEVERSAMIRVLVAEGVDSLEVHGLDMQVYDAQTWVGLHCDRTDAIVFGHSDGKVVVDGKTAKTDRIAVKSPAVFLSLSGGEYRSPLEIRVLHGQLAAISHVELRHYLPGVVAGEMPSYWPFEALKAQAVAARTYAWAQHLQSEGEPYDVVADIRDQVYPGADADSVVAVQAVRQTAGIVLVVDGRVAPVYYHSTCGGVTEVASNVWPRVTNPLSPVVCRYCEASPSFRWTAELPANALAEVLRGAGFDGGAVKVLNVLTRSPSGRALEIEVEGDGVRTVVDGNTFRKLAGYGRVKSTRFTAKVADDVVRFEGEGLGHGVGMCQWGARGMALAGKTAEEILDFYYPGTQRFRLKVGSAAVDSGGGTKDQ